MKLKKLILILITIFIMNLYGCTYSQVNIPDLKVNSDQKNYDLIVVGADPEGISAAVTAGRNGLDVLLVSSDKEVGGLMTLGKLNFIDMNHDKDGTLITEGIFKEFYDKVGGSAFDIQKAIKVFRDMLNESNVTVKLNAKVIEPIKEDNNLVGVKVLKNETEKEYLAKRFIDATQDADFSALAGVPYTFAGEDIGEKDRMMGVTLVFELKDVSWFKVFSYLNWNRVMGYIKKDERKHEGAKLDSAWGYTKVGYAYEPKDELMRLRGFNIAKQPNGHVLINALVIFGVDVLDENSKENGIKRANEELKHLVPYIKENFVGFKNAELVGTADELYVRESRHIIGEYQLTIDDVLENKDKWDKIALGSYPVDVQPTVNQRWGTVVGNPDKYSIPFRSLVPLKVENLLVVGRSASYKSLAAGSARVIPVGMCEGQAAGVASAYSLKNSISFRDMSKSKEAIKAVQDELVKEGAYLESFDIPNPLANHFAYEGIRTIRSLGLLDGGYSNDYYLEDPVNKWFFQNLINNVLAKAGKPSANYIEVNPEPKVSDILKATNYGLTGELTDDFAAIRASLTEKNILDQKLLPYFKDDSKRPQRAEVIMLGANVYKYLLNEEN